MNEYEEMNKEFMQCYLANPEKYHSYPLTFYQIPGDHPSLRRPVPINKCPPLQNLTEVWTSGSDTLSITSGVVQLRRSFE